MESSVPLIELDNDAEKHIITLDALESDFDSDNVPVVTLEDDVANEPLVISLDDDKAQNDSDIITDDRTYEVVAESADIICDGALKHSETINDDVEISHSVIILDDSDNLVPETTSSLHRIPFIKTEETIPSTSGNEDIELDVILSPNPLKSISNSNKKLQECKKCHKMFPTVQKLNNHPCKRRFLCDTCNETFFDKNALIKHVKTHSEGKPYICDICFKEFSDKNILRMHYNTHTGEKPFACTICDKVFPNTLALKNHYELHTGEKPYVCDVCLASFDHKSSLCNHKLDEHKFLTII